MPIKTKNKKKIFKKVFSEFESGELNIGKSKKKVKSKKQAEAIAISISKKNNAKNPKKKK